MGLWGLRNAETPLQEFVQKAGQHKTALTKDIQQRLPLEEILATLETH